MATTLLNLHYGGSFGTLAFHRRSVNKGRLFLMVEYYCFHCMSLHAVINI